MSSPPPDPSIPLFRPSKKRKLYRARPSTDDQSPSPTTITTTSPPPPAAQSLDELIASTSSTISTPNNPTDDEPSIAALLRQRQQRRPRAGVGFSVAGARDGEGRSGFREEHGEVVLNEGETVGGVERKFAPQTGTVGDVNKHMMAFIDSRLAHSRLQTHEAPNPTKPTNAHPKSIPMPESDRAPATLGRLQEIDLGDEARSRNEAQTKLARRRLDGVEDEDADGDDATGGMSKKGKKNAKVRLGPDGKPWRGRKRRGSDDVKRDKMVEDVLRENRLEIYEPPPSPPPISDDQAADDRIAEAFRREFMDAVSQRQRKAVPQVQQAPAARGVGGKKEEELKGPKLGGSRSARAAMREMMLKGGKK